MGATNAIDMLKCMNGQIGKHQTGYVEARFNNDSAAHWHKQSGLDKVSY